jgi:hypothetical protein
MRRRSCPWMHTPSRFIRSERTGQPLKHSWKEAFGLTTSFVPTGAGPFSSYAALGIDQAVRASEALAAGLKASVTHAARRWPSSTVVTRRSRGAWKCSGRRGSGDGLPAFKIESRQARPRRQEDGLVKLIIEKGISRAGRRSSASADHPGVSWSTSPSCTAGCHFLFGGGADRPSAFSSSTPCTIQLLERLRQPQQG